MVVAFKSSKQPNSSNALRAAIPFALAAALAGCGHARPYVEQVRIPAPHANLCTGERVFDRKVLKVGESMKTLNGSEIRLVELAGYPSRFSKTYPNGYAGFRVFDATGRLVELTCRDGPSSQNPDERGTAFPTWGFRVIVEKLFLGPDSTVKWAQIAIVECSR